MQYCKTGPSKLRYHFDDLLIFSSFFSSPFTFFYSPHLCVLLVRSILLMTAAMAVAVAAMSNGDCCGVYMVVAIVRVCVYANKGDLIDILALINSGINFILYCSMSRQFRKTFIVLFRPKFLNRWLSLGHDDENQGAGHTYIGRDENNGLTTQVTQV